MFVLTYLPGIRLPEALVDVNINLKNKCYEED